MKWLKDLLNKVTNYDAVVKENKTLRNQVKILSDNINLGLVELSTLNEKYLGLKRLYTELIHQGDIDIYDLLPWFESKRNIKSWEEDFYMTGKDLDVKTALRVSKEGVIKLEAFAQKLITKYNLGVHSEEEKILEALMKHFSLRRSWTYVTDPKQYDKIDYWALAEVSLTSLKGDCDDLAILMHNLAYYMFEELRMPHAYPRLTFTAGVLLNEGGHAFNTWLGNDGKYYVVESTYDLKNSYKKTWLKSAINNNNLYVKFYGFSTKFKSWRGEGNFFEEYKRGK